MIDVQIDAASYTMNDELRDMTRQKIGALDRYMDSLTSAHVAFSWSGGEGERTSVHAQVWGGGHRYEASASEWKALTALDQARDKLETEIRRGHSKEIDERRGRGH